MIQRSEHARLALEPSEAIGVARERGRQDLDGDIAGKLRVERTIHLTHATGAEHGAQPILA
jgi:hypothetical protein